MTRIHVDMFEPTDPRLGRHVEHDERSRAYATVPKDAKPKRVTAHWPSHVGVLDQGSTGSCTGNALAQWLNTDFGQRYADARAPLTEADAVKIYSLATHLDAVPGVFPPNDTGSTGNAACKAGRQLGYLRSYGWAFSFTSTQAALEQTPVLAGTVWTQKMFHPVNGLVTVGKISDSTVAGGHEYLLSGIDWQEGVIEARNSWGGQPQWPGCKPGGYFAISFADFARLLDADGDITVPRTSA